MANVNETTVGTMLPQVGLNGSAVNKKSTDADKFVARAVASTKNKVLSGELTEALLEYIDSDDIAFSESTFNMLVNESNKIANTSDIKSKVSSKFMALCAKKSAMTLKLKAMKNKIKKKEEYKLDETDAQKLTDAAVDLSKNIISEQKNIEKEINSCNKSEADIYKQCDKAADRYATTIYNIYFNTLDSIDDSAKKAEDDVKSNLEDTFSDSNVVKAESAEIVTEGVAELANILFFVVSGVLSIFTIALTTWVSYKEQKRSEENRKRIDKAFKNMEEYFLKKDPKNFLPLSKCTVKTLSLLPSAKNEDIDEKTRKLIKEAISFGYVGLIAYFDSDNKGVIAAGYTAKKIFFKIIQDKYKDYKRFYYAWISWFYFGYVDKEDVDYLNKLANDIYNEDRVNVLKAKDRVNIFESAVNIFEAESEPKKEEDTVDPQVKRLDELRGKVTDLEKEIKKNKELYDATSDETFNKKIKGLTAKLDRANKELADGEAFAKKEEARIAKEKEKEVKESMMLEAADIEDEIKPIVDTFNSKGYQVKYASPGHSKLRKKEDRGRDGEYYGKLYSDARVMFDKKYKFPDAPEYWHWRDVDGCSYLDITPIPFNNEKFSNEDEAFVYWKEKYMKSLSDFADSLDSQKTESVCLDIKSFVNEMYQDFVAGKKPTFVSESVEDDPLKDHHDKLLKELDDLIG